MLKPPSSAKINNDWNCMPLSTCACTYTQYMIVSHTVTVLLFLYSVSSLLKL